jgi:hypothetical protein
MTNLELAQSASTFIRAGRAANRLGVDRISNPYPKIKFPKSTTQQTYHGLWDEGWALEIEKKPVRKNVYAHKTSKSPRPYRGNQQLDRDRRTIGKRDVRHGQR